MDSGLEQLVGSGISNRDLIWCFLVFFQFLRDPGLAGFEELYSPAEDEPQAVEVGEGSGLEGETP